MQYRLLGRSGLRVSELCLGTMTFGTEWGNGADREESRRMFYAFLEAGGNFIDTANRYTEGSSEAFLGQFVHESPGLRDSLVLATKYSLHTRPGDLNNAGNHRKNLVRSLEGSLRRLQTNYVDVLYLHAWDDTTPVDEVMRALDDVVRAGKVLYVAISDTPAWVVSRSQMLAELRGWSPFIALQVEYSLIQRSVEHDLVPMARTLDLAVLAWGPVAGGALTGKYLPENPAGAEGPKRLTAANWRLAEAYHPVVRETLAVASEMGATPSQVALAWLMAQPGVVIPITGARSLDQLQDNLQAANLRLSPEQMARLASKNQPTGVFPHDFLAQPYAQDLLFGGEQSKLKRHR
jgi:aryl-alcohol dehydrogenase-like predicted oxidoreductase